MEDNLTLISKKKWESGLWERKGSRGLKMEVFHLSDSAEGLLGPLSSHPPTQHRSSLVRSHARPSWSWLGCLRLQNRPQKSPWLSLYKKKSILHHQRRRRRFFFLLHENNVRLACVKHIVHLPGISVEKVKSSQIKAPLAIVVYRHLKLGILRKYMQNWVPFLLMSQKRRLSH